MAPTKVRVDALLIGHAQEHFPPGGSPDGRPSYEAFERGPLAAAIALFSRAFDKTPEIVPGIRSWVTIGVPLFPPMAFYAARVETEIVLLDVTIEDPQDYWALLDADPWDS